MPGAATGLKPPGAANQVVDPLRGAPGAAVVLMVAVVLLFGINWPVMKIGLSVVPPLWFGALRLLPTSVFLFVILVIWRRRWVWPSAQDLPVILSVSGLQMFGTIGLVTFALLYVPPGRAAVLIYTTPIWVLLVERVAFGRRPSLRGVVAVAFAVAGLALFIVPELASVSADPSLAFGYGLLLVAALLWALGMIHVRRHRWRLTPLDLLPWQTLIAGLPFLVAAFLIEGRLPASAYSLTGLWALLYTGLAVTGLGFLGLIEAGRRLPPTVIATISTLTPVVGLAASVILTGETITLPLALGTALVLLGVTLLRPARR